MWVTWILSTSMYPNNNFGFKQLWKKEKITRWYYPMLFLMRLAAVAGASAKGERELTREKFIIFVIQFKNLLLIFIAKNRYVRCG